MENDARPVDHPAKAVLMKGAYRPENLLGSQIHTRQWARPLPLVVQNGPSQLLDLPPTEGLDNVRRRFLQIAPLFEKQKKVIDFGQFPEQVTVMIVHGLILSSAAI
jgi:hypothetical protein